MMDPPESSAANSRGSSIAQDLPASIARSRWLVPGVAVVTLVATLVVAGIIPLSTVLSLGLFGGMMLMHLGGHGIHGSHGGHAQHERDEQAGLEHERLSATPSEAARQAELRDAADSHGCH